MHEYGYFIFVRNLFGIRCRSRKAAQLLFAKDETNENK